MSPPLILLKTRSTPTDPYEDLLRAQTTTPIFVPVLQHFQTNLGQLRDALAAVHERYGALIITSQRSVEAVGFTLHSMEKSCYDVRALRENTVVYVVGPATAAAVVALGFEPANVRGADCGSGAVLAPYILEDYGKREMPMLFLVGETVSNVIQSHLRENGVVCEELVVYRTDVVHGFEEDFRVVMEETKGAPVRWVAVFSPTGADVAEKVVKGKDEEDGGRTFWAAIGPTTEKHLEGLGRTPDAIAKIPSPAGLWEAIGGFMKKLKEESAA